MKSGLFRITSFENDRDPSVMNHYKQHRKLNCIKKKIMLFVWWDWKGVVFFELLPRNQTINFYFYCRQLNKLNAVVKEKWPAMVNRKGVIFQHDNATQHIFSHSPKMVKA